MIHQRGGAVLAFATIALCLGVAGGCVDGTRPIVSAAPAGPLVGSVTLANGAPVGGGTVELYLGSTLARAVTVSAAGTYAFDSLAAATYDVRLQPELHYSMGSGEPLQRTATISTGQVTSARVDFVVQPAMYADDFQSYTTTAQLIQGCGASLTAGNLFAGAGHDMNCANQTQIVLDPTGGPQNTKAMRYDWPARPTGTTNYTVALQPRFNPPAAMTSSLYIRWTDRLSPGFRIGGAGFTGSGLEYKYLFVDLNAVGTSLGTFVFEMDSKTTAPTDQLTVRTKLVDFVSSATDSDPNNYSLGTSFLGNWHTWVLEVTGIGGPTVTYRIWLDGNVIQTITGPFFPNKTLGGPGTTMTVELGANINNGPDVAQSRWFREFGVYTSRPSLRSLPP